MDIGFLNDYFVPVIAGICAIVGVIIKHWIPDAILSNKVIPTTCAILGAGLAVIIHWGAITPESILGGLFSGLAATGLHQAVTKLTAEKYDESEVAEDDFDIAA